MMPAAFDLQSAVAAHLLADAGLVATLGGPRIHDGAPRNAAFPYVTLGETSASDWASGTEEGGDIRLTLHVWSRAAGKREAWTIIGGLMRLLHDQPIALEQHALVLMRVAFAEVRGDPDGLTEHGVVRLVALIEGG